MPISRFLSFLVVAATLAVPPSAQAQSTTASPMPAASGAPMMGHHHHRHHDSMMRMLRSLDLTDAQKQQVQTFHQQEIAANKNADAATRHANAAKMHDEVMGILTPDQKARMQANMQRHHGMGHDAMPVPAASPGAQ